MLQAGARALLPNERVARCLWCPIASLVGVHYASGARVGHYSGLMVCGSVWSCPVCGAKVSERRRVELSGGLSKHMAAGGSLALATFTLQHARGQSLAVVLACLLASYREVLRGAFGVRFRDRYGYVGAVRGLEVTWTYNAGWHPHLHVLLFLGAGVDVDEVRTALDERYRLMVGKHGGYASPLYGVHVTAASQDIQDYVTKWNKPPRWDASHETAKGNVKLARDESKGRPLNQLLADYVLMADDQAGALFQEGVAALTGCSQLRWSAGLRDRLGLGVELSDLELAKQEREDAVLLACLSREQWKIVCANDARDAVVLAAPFGPDAVYEVLSRIGAI